jgi:hypothetical protein
MILATADRDTSYAGAVNVRAGQRVVMPLPAAQLLLDAGRRNGFKVRISGLGHYVRPCCGQNLGGKSLLAWRGHGVGDQLQWAGLCRILKLLYPTAEIDYYCHPCILPLWENVPGLPFKVYHEPIAFENWTAYDYHLLGEGLCEADQEPDQPCHWDGMLNLAGLRNVADDWKRPLCPVSPEDLQDAAAWLQTSGLPAPVPGRGDSVSPDPSEARSRPAAEPAGASADPESAGRASALPAGVRGAAPLVLWQLAASTPIRSYAPGQTRKALALLAAALPAGALLVVVGSAADFAAYAPLPQAPCIRLADDLPLRTVFALAHRHADVVACPDSCLGHAAAGVIPWAPELPPRAQVVSLWGAFAPADRVRYYANHEPLVGVRPCSPCRTHETRLPPAGCPREGGFCRALAAVAPDQIVSAVLSALNRNPEKGT